MLTQLLPPLAFPEGVWHLDNGNSISNVFFHAIFIFASFSFIVLSRYVHKPQYTQAHFCVSCFAQASFLSFPSFVTSPFALPFSDLFLLYLALSFSFPLDSLKLENRTSDISTTLHSADLKQFWLVELILKATCLQQV